MRAISIFHQKYRWMDDHEEMTDLILASGYNEVTSISFKKLHVKNYLPEQKIQELINLIDENEVNTIIFNEALSVKHLQALVKKLDREDVELLDKAMLILKIFARKANSTDIQLQIKLAEMKYVLPRIRQEIGATLFTDKQARERGTGDSLADIMKSDVKKRISIMENRIAELRKDIVHESKLLTFPILGFYSVGKTTLFNILSDSNRETDSQAFTTMFLKSSWSKLLGFPIEIVDTVGIVDLPSLIIESFSVMLNRIFSSPQMIICADASLDSDLFNDQLEGLHNYFKRFAIQDLKYRILFIFTKCDKINENQFEEYSEILNDLITKGKFPCERFQIMGARSDRSINIQQTFVTKIGELLEGQLFEFEFSKLTVSELSKVHDISKIHSEVWDGSTVSVKSIIPIQMYNSHLAMLQSKLTPESLKRWEELSQLQEEPDDDELFFDFAEYSQNMN